MADAGVESQGGVALTASNAYGPVAASDAEMAPLSGGATHRPPRLSCPCSSCSCPASFATSCVACAAACMRMSGLAVCTLALRLVLWLLFVALLFVVLYGGSIGPAVPIALVTALVIVFVASFVRVAAEWTLANGAAWRWGGADLRDVTSSEDTVAAAAAERRRRRRAGLVTGLLPGGLGLGLGAGRHQLQMQQRLLGLTAVHVRQLRAEGLSEAQVAALMSVRGGGAGGGAGGEGLSLDEAYDTLLRLDALVAAAEAAEAAGGGPEAGAGPPRGATPQDIGRLPAYTFHSRGAGKAPLPAASAGAEAEAEAEALALAQAQAYAEDDDDEDAMLALAIRQSLAEAARASPAALTVAAAEAAAPPPAAKQQHAQQSPQADERADGFYCAICLEPYSEGTRVRTLPCFHSMCAACVDPWLAQRATCPVCKSSILDAALLR